MTEKTFIALGCYSFPMTRRRQVEYNEGDELLAYVLRFADSKVKVREVAEHFTEAKLRKLKELRVE